MKRGVLRFSLIIIYFDTVQIKKISNQQKSDY